MSSVRVLAYSDTVLNYHSVFQMMLYNVNHLNGFSDLYPFI